MCRYIGDSQRTTPTTGSFALTGSVESDVSKNIYDFAGNCDEWTMEAGGNANNRVGRGGDFNNNKAISFRYSYDLTNCNGYYSFRPTLYIK